MVEAIKEASGSLTTTCSTLNQVADDTRGRMASASSASAETTQRMAATVAATEALSESIDEIGRLVGAWLKTGTHESGTRPHTTADE